MSSSKNQNQSDPLQSIYFQDFLEHGRKPKLEVKGAILFFLCHIGLVGAGYGVYTVLPDGILSDLSTTSSYQDNGSVEEAFTLSISDSSITLNLDDDESKRITFSTNADGNTGKNLSISRDNSEIVTIESEDSEAGKITYIFTAKELGSDSLTFKLVDTDNPDTIYDSKTVSIKVTGTLNHGNFANHSYQVFENSLSWTDAEEACESVGGHLATIESAEEQDFIKNLIKSTKKENLWIGGYYSSDAWNWVDNTPWDYTNWDNLQPDNYTGDEFYLRIKNRDKTYENWEAMDGKWNDTANDADDSSENSDAPMSSFGYVCEWDLIETTIIGGLKASNDKGYNPPSQITDCFGHDYTVDQAFSLTFAGTNQSRVTFDFKGVNYRTFEYDVTVDQDTRDKFENSEEYSFDSDFPLCDFSLVAIQSDGNETYCSEAHDGLYYGFFGESEAIHHTVILPEDTVAIQFEGNAMQSVAGVKVIIANAKLTTLIQE